MGLKSDEDPLQTKGGDESRDRLVETFGKRDDEVERVGREKEAEKRLVGVLL